MAASASSGRKKTSASSGRGNKNKRKTAAKKQPARTAQDSAILNEVILIVIFALAVLLFLCNFGVVGVVGDRISKVMFGIFGLCAYVVPILTFLAVAFGISNQGNRAAARKLAAGVLLILLIGVVSELIAGNQNMVEPYSLKTFYEQGSNEKKGGGVIAGSLAWVLYHFMGMVGTVLLVLVLGIICIVVITEKSFLGGIRSSGRHVYETAKTEAEYYRQQSELRRQEAQERQEEMELRRRETLERRRKKDEEAQERRRQREQEARAKRQERQREKQEEKIRREDEQILRMDKKVSGVMLDTSLKEPKKSARMRDDIHEITLNDAETEAVEVHKIISFTDRKKETDFDNIRIHTMHQQSLDETEGFEEAEEAKETENAESLLDSGSAARARAYDSMDSRETGQEAGGFPEGLEAYRNEEPVSTRTLHVSPSSGADDRSCEEEKPEEEELPFGDVYSDMKEMRPYAAKPASTDTGYDGQEARPRPKAVPPKPPETAAQATQVGAQLAKQEKEKKKVPEKPYRFPPISLLHKTAARSVDSSNELKNTARRLQETLETFGVGVTITDISQGPAVTRYELQPEQGVKVSKIVGLSDDIKLNLAATDIRIEAPIPGKAAIGIEVPNKENTAVGLRELLETKEFKEFPSDIAFAVGKDIAGKAVVSDIAKMPHMLIAGATGSGKSVCINTLIMSILYKADPKDVKLILVDPKVVELSVYNGIPHLLIPVVTDPKKASAALQWAVAEMSDRYQKFANYSVRDLKGYNKKVEELLKKGDPDAPAKLPKIVIIVDELADLMMVAPGEVEEAICRLAQLARACGIHLIIATQRPSVDVITGLIKANMPSRVAFAVSSGVDSRTILDMNGAEKLLGKGDMLFYPQGYAKPVRVQGAFVTDNEVADVVDFLKNQAIGNSYNEDVEEKLKNFHSTSGSSGTEGGQPEYDPYFAEAGRFIIDKDKASIGMLQRVFKIGFNRAARIMDQLAEVGVVGEEEGTKPRKILMTMDEFEQLVEEII